MIVRVYGNVMQLMNNFSRELSSCSQVMATDEETDMTWQRTFMLWTLVQ